MAKFDRVIPPGQEGKINLVIDGKRVHGKFSKSATVRSNDPNYPTMTLTMSGNVTPYITVTPSNRVFLQGQYGESVHKMITLKTNEENVDFKVTKVESNIDDKITYKARPNEEDGTWAIDVWKNPKLPTMSTFGTLTVHTNSERSPTKTVQLQVITKGSITIEPKAVNFGTVKIDTESDEPVAPITRNVIVLKATGDFQIEDVTFSADYFSAEVEPVQPGKRYNIKVTFAPPKKKQGRKTHIAEMTVHTNDPREPALTVRLVARTM